MAKKFNLGDYLNTENVSRMDTEQIVKIDLDRIDPDPNNFYSLEGIDELAANIETVGLLDALRVRPEGERYVIVSGHRRRAACMLIRDGGSEQFADGVPCIVEYGEATPAMRELRLIFANANTRIMSAADLSRQAERTEAVLLELKAQGVEFKGRMRSHVAEILRVSESKIARAHAIRANLVPVLLEKFDAGLLNEATAYRLSQEPQEMQDKVWRSVGISISGVSAETVGTIIDQVKKHDEPKAEPEQGSPYRGREEVEEYLAKRAEEDADFRELLLGTSEEFIRELKGVCTRQDGIEMLRKRLGACYAGWWHGGPHVSCSPKGVQLDGGGHRITRTWTQLYDVLCTIALNGAKTKSGPSRAPAPTWETGEPPRPGRYFCRVDMETTKPIENRCTWNGKFWEIYGAKLDDRWKVVNWWPLPEEI